MNQISLSDKIFATFSSLSSTVVNLDFDGVRSMSEVVRRVAENLSASSPRSGIITVRNSSQGWAIRRTITFPQPPEAVQLSLF